MLDLKDLYREVIVDHNKSPRNYHKLEDAHHSAEGFNPLCGDKITVYLKIDNGVISDVSFEGEGCAISVASASLMTEYLKGKTEDEADAVFGSFHDLVTNPEPRVDSQELGKLRVLAGVREFPARVKCATLCWHTLEAALKDRHNIVSTE